MKFLAALQSATPTPGETPPLRDIAPPVDIFPYPLWMVIAAGLAALALFGLVAFLVRRWMRSRPAPPPPLPQAIALRKLDDTRAEVETTDPYLFSIRVSDILRSYISERYRLPATQQTSPEFLAAASNLPTFSEPLRESLGRFLEKADLIKFARIEATAGDSRELLDLAVQIVREESP